MSKKTFLAEKRKQNKATAGNERFGVSRGVARGHLCGILEVCRPHEH
jgi:hypothetical protein